jgi:hypothetical protein
MYHNPELRRDMAVHEPCSEKLTTDKEVDMKTSSSAKILAEAINRAIEDHIISTADYEEIMRIANSDYPSRYLNRRRFPGHPIAL